MRVLIFLAILLSFTSFAFAQQSINDIAWIAGDWHGEGFGGETYESWSVPMGGTMLGVFSIVGNDKTKLYEFLTIEESEGGIYFRFKHFSPGYKPWEETPITLKLEEENDMIAVFEAVEKDEKLPRKLIYNNKGENKLMIQIVGWGSEDDPNTYTDLYFEK